MKVRQLAIVLGASAAATVASAQSQTASRGPLSPAVTPTKTVVGAGVNQAAAIAPLASQARATMQVSASPVAASHVASNGWHGLWDVDTAVPVKLWGQSEAAVGAMASPGIAREFALAFLEKHLATLAPGASITDFLDGDNVLAPTGDMRTVSFLQTHHGIPVLDSAVSVAFKNDRLFLATSSAKPHVVLPPQSLARSVVAMASTTKAAQWIEALAQAPTRVVAQDAATVVLPMVKPSRGSKIEIEYRLAQRAQIALQQGVGKWDVWFDATSGEPLANKNLIHFATATVKYHVPARSPTAGFVDLAAPFTRHTIDGQTVVSDAAGVITWNGNSTSLVPGVSGPRVNIQNEGGGIATASLPLMAGATPIWAVSEEYSQAQLAAFVHANIAKEFARQYMAPNMPYLTQTLQVYVNEVDPQGQQCNAYSTGDDIHFYPRNVQCENTALLADVVYHEFGHSLHAQSVIRGVGQFDSALSEGVSDFLAASITDDHGMGRGFFYNDSALRDIDPVGIELKYPSDVVESVHKTGEIIGGALWDMRKALIAKLGREAGTARTLKLYYAVLQRASNIQTSFPEILAADDDDGNLENGTPNQCALIDAFLPHGLVDLSSLVGLEPPKLSGWQLTMKNTAAATACEVPTVMAATAQWRVVGDAGAQGNFPLKLQDGVWSGEIPAQPDGKKVEYRVVAQFSNGTSLAYPNNPASPFYETFTGPVETLWCANFEEGAVGWTLGNRWEVGGTSQGQSDPKAPYAGNGMLGLNLTRGGNYTRGGTVAQSPDIDTQGKSHVRLQYRRWLTVEDGYYDQARIVADGKTLWSNFASKQEPMNSVNHVDREWVFHDLDVSDLVADGKINLRFELTADQGLSLGGWTLDDVCIVASAAPLPGSAVCGNGVVEGAETCDDGNIDDDDGCADSCTVEVDYGGCSSAGGSGVWLLLCIGGALALPRRRK